MCENVCTTSTVIPSTVIWKEWELIDPGTYNFISVDICRFSWHFRACNSQQTPNSHEDSVAFRVSPVGIVLMLPDGRWQDIHPSTSGRHVSDGISNSKRVGLIYRWMDHLFTGPLTNKKSAKKTQHGISGRGELPKHRQIFASEDGFLVMIR